MTFAGDGWICRSCWNSNRWQDERCYRCKAPRDADDATLQEHRAKREGKRARGAAVSGVVTTIPSFVMRWYARIVLGFSLMLLAFLPFGLDRPTEEVALYAGFVGLMFSMGLLFRWAAHAMQDSNPIAFVVTLVLSGAAVTSMLVDIATMPEGFRWLGNLFFYGFGLSAILSAIGLVLCLLPAKAPTEETTHAS